MVLKSFGKCLEKFGHGLHVHLRDHDLDQTMIPRLVANV
jgi:hypothetical protein